MILRRVSVVIAMLFAITGVLTSQAFATQGDGTYVGIVTGSQAAGSVETVDGVAATQAPGVFQQGTAVAGTRSAPATMMAPLSPSGCRDAGVNWEAATDVFGATVWKIWNHTHWCYSNWQVTSVTGWTDVFTGPGWSSSNITWGWGWWSQPATARSTSHAHFCLASYFGCVQTADPNVNTWVNGAGNYSFDNSNWYPGS